MSSGVAETECVREFLRERLQHQLSHVLSLRFVDDTGRPFKSRISVDHVVELLFRQLQHKEFAAGPSQAFMLQAPKDEERLAMWVNQAARRIAERELERSYVSDCLLLAEFLAETTTESRQGTIIDRFRQAHEWDARFLLESMLLDFGAASGANVDEAWELVMEQVFLPAPFMSIATDYHPERGRTFASYLWCRLTWRSKDAVRRLGTRPDVPIGEKSGDEGEEEPEDWWGNTAEPDRTEEFTPEFLAKLCHLLKKCLASLSNRPLRGFSASQRRDQRSVFDLTYKLYVPPDLVHLETVCCVGEVLRQRASDLKTQCTCLVAEIADLRKTLATVYAKVQRKEPLTDELPPRRQVEQKLNRLEEELATTEWKLGLAIDKSLGKDAVGSKLVERDYQAVHMLLNDLSELKLSTLFQRIICAQEAVESYERRLEARQVSRERQLELRRQAVGRIQDFLETDEEEEDLDDEARMETLYIVAWLRLDKARRAQEEALTLRARLAEMKPPWARSQNEVRDLLDIPQPTVYHRLQEAWVYLRAQAALGELGAISEARE